MVRIPQLRPLAHVLTLLWWAVACAPVLPVAAPPAAAANATPTSPLNPSPVPTVTPTPSLVPQAVSFSAPDGAALHGQQYGAGELAVIFSPMGDCVGDWADLAAGAAANSFLALTFQWRACQPAGVDAELLRFFVDDLRGAVSFAHAQGAARVVLVGASLGGVASAKLLAETGAVGLVVMAAPADVPSLGVSVVGADLEGVAPKLFMTAEADEVVPASTTRALHDLAAEPKAWQTYPGTAHGTHLFDTASGADAQQRILDFILAASAP